MNRRAFLGLLGAGAAGFALDPERLLWVPGQKTYFLPAPQPMLYSIGDFVVLKEGATWIHSTDGSVYALGAVAGKLSRVSKGRVGVVADYKDGSPIVQVYGLADIPQGSVMLAYPWSDGNQENALHSAVAV